MTAEQLDTVETVKEQLEFMSVMIIAWDTKTLDFGKLEQGGLYFMLQALYKELNSITS